MHDRIVCLNDPVNWVDPYGLQCGAPTAPGIPWFPPIFPPVFYPGTPENQMLVDDVLDIIDWLKKQMEGSGDKNDLTEGDSYPVDNNSPPNHPDFDPHKKKKEKEKIPWNKNRKGFPDKSGNYWEPVPDGHKGTHDPHWDVQHPNGTHTPVYPPK